MACAKNLLNRACSVHASNYSLEIWCGGIPDFHSQALRFTFYGAISLEKWYSNEKRYSPTKGLSITNTTEDGSTNAVLQILYGPYLILGVFGSYMF
jgi:hypothetical protein